MEYIGKFDFVLYASTPEMARFASGFLIKEILEHFTQKVNSTLNPDRVLWLYSGHDYSITNALNSFGLFKEVENIFISRFSLSYVNFTITIYFIKQIHLPKYASSLAFELYKTNHGGYYVQLFYKKSEGESPQLLDIPECGKKCPLDKFDELCQKFIPKNDIDTECRL